MQLWFQELNKQAFGLIYQVRKTLCHLQSPYQEITILETEGMGRMMVLDGCIMLTERDEFLYHEMLVHPALCTHPHPERVLVIGGGDGGTVLELLRHPEVKHIDMVELDEMVVKVSREFFPALSSGLDDPRVHLAFEDGVAWLTRNLHSYDVIIIDSTDPVGPAAGLITKDFFATCRKSLREGGIFVMQSESPFVHQEEIQKIHRNLRSVFPSPTLYLSPMLCYPSGWWSFTMASLGSAPREGLQVERAQAIATKTKYFNPETYRASFALPNFVRDLLQPTEK